MKVFFYFINVFAIALINHTLCTKAIGCEVGNNKQGYWKYIADQYDLWDRCIIPGEPDPLSPTHFNNAAYFIIDGRYKVVTRVTPASQSHYTKTLISPGNWMEHTWYWDKNGKQVSSPAECPPACVKGPAEWYAAMQAETNVGSLHKFTSNGQYLRHEYRDDRQHIIKYICYTDYVSELYEWVCYNQDLPQAIVNLGAGGGCS